ncbi:filamentous hemagglutinin N-terminal domain-containing protein, partial [Emcibacter nanhaiensis]
MNKVYRLVWSKIKSAWVAVCEFAKSAGKSGTVGLSKTVIGIIVLSLLGLNGIALADPAVNALPTGGQITAGSGGIGQYGTSMLVRQDSQKMIVTWQSFDIGSNASVTFYQPSSSSIALNRVLGEDPSQILGRLNANGHVMLVNPAGIVFGDGSQVNVGGITASTLDIADEDFLAGHFNFINPDDAAAVENFGHILSRGGVVALVAPVVKNQGSIDASNGSAALAAGDDITLDFSGDGLVTVTVNRSDLDRLIENKGAIRAGDGVVILTAGSARDLLSSVVNNSGIIEAEGITQHGGRILLDGGSVTNTGTLNAGSDSHDGGSIAIDGQTVMLGGDIGADGVNGGSINVASEGLLSLADKVHAKGRNGDGGIIHYRAERIMEITTGSTDASGSENGGSISVDGGGKFASSGSYRADGVQGEGGYIDITANAVYLLSADIDASGGDSGGLVRIGGAFQGGKTPDPAQPYYDSFLGRWGDTDSIRNADTSFVNDATAINVSGGNGQGGTVVVWSDTQTTFLGSVDATGAVGGGSVELSSAGELRKVALSGVTLGGGQLLLDPKDIIIGDENIIESWAYAGIMGSIIDIDTELEAGDQFGRAVALNAAGDRLAVGADYDDGAANNKTRAGAVYLFSFADTEFSGGALEALIGYGYTGGKNIDTTSHVARAGEGFGLSVSLNAAGDRLAVGEVYDYGANNNVIGSGAVHLFSFTDTSFSGGVLEATIGADYTGGKNIDETTLGAHYYFGSSVSLNAAGDRLAVGAWIGNTDNYPGKVYLYSFTDTSFSGGVLEAEIGARTSSGGKNLPLSLNQYDFFGRGVSLNAAGDRLAVGVPGKRAVYLYSFSDTSFSGVALEATVDNSPTGVKDVYVDTIPGFGESISLNAAGDRLAAGTSGTNSKVYLISFTDGDFNGGVWEAAIGVGETGGKNIDMTGPVESGDYFGHAVSLNAAGDRLAVGAYRDDGYGNAKTYAGAVYLFSFSDTSFSGGSLQATMGGGYVAGKDVNVAELETGNDAFGISTSLNAAGDRLAVGAWGDDGIGESVTDSGAAYLFSFTDVAFSGGALEAIAGSGYSGGKNVDVAALEASDAFGSGVALNAAGDRLVVGASGDDGSGNGVSDSGAAYFFSFTDSDFTGGVLEATLGSGYSGGKNVDVANLEADDGFGSGVSLNAAGDRLVVGASGDDGSGNGASDSGAVYLFSFSDADFTGGALEATLGSGYSGSKNIDVANLEAGDAFGGGVALNATGDRLVVGASGDDGSANGASDSGAVHLFSFSDADFTGGALEATLGSGYSGGKNIDVTSLEAGDAFGSSVSFNAAGDQLAVGASGDDGDGNVASDSGAAYLFDFTDTSFTGGSLETTLGFGYSTGYDVAVSSLEADDAFGSAISLNANGDLLAVGAAGYDGVGNIEDGSGGVYLFIGTEVSLTTPLNDATTYVSLSGQTANVLASDLAAQLSTGASVTLQASNDITVSSAVIVDNASGDGGALSLNAGRSILVDADITTDNGALYLYANDTLANSVVDADRDAGAAVISLASGVSLDAGTGAVELLIRDGAGKTNAESGDITLDGAITADTIVLGNEGPTAGSGVVLDSNTSLTAAGTGTAIDIYGDSFTNNAGAAVLSAANGRWLVWSDDPAGDTRGGLSYDFKQYNAVHGSSTVLGSGNGFLYELAPTLTAAVTGSISKVYDGTVDASVGVGDLSVLSGVVDGDSVILSAPTSASYDDKNVGAGKTVTATGVSLVSASNGAAVVYGYQMASADASGITGE